MQACCCAVAGSLQLNTPITAALAALERLHRAFEALELPLVHLPQELEGTGEEVTAHLVATVLLTAISRVGLNLKRVLECFNKLSTRCTRGPGFWQGQICRTKTN
jgi:hypothetical protein